MPQNLMFLKFMGRYGTIIWHRVRAAAPSIRVFSTIDTCPEELSYTPSWPATIGARLPKGADAYPGGLVDTLSEPGSHRLR